MPRALLLFVLFYLVSTPFQHAQAAPEIIIISAECVGDTIVDGVASTKLRLVLDTTTASYFGMGLYLYYSPPGLENWQPIGIPMDALTGIDGNVADYILPFTMTAPLDLLLAVDNPFSINGTYGEGQNGSDVTVQPCSSVPATGSICGQKLWDVNCNGVADSADIGLAGWVITLRPNNISVMTDDAGHFCFDGLALEEDYYIEEEQQEGWTQTMPQTRDYHVRLGAGGFSPFLQFANCRGVVPDPICAEECNLVENADFSLGDALFTSDLDMICGGCDIGAYCVGSSFRSKCTAGSWSATAYDHTQGDATGSFMSIDGSTSSSEVPLVVWKQVGLGVVQNLPYTFSFWGRNVYTNAGAPFDIDMVIRDGSGAVLHRGTATITLTAGWVHYSTTWTPTTTEAVTIELVQTTEDAYRDFGIDDLFFGTCPCPCEPKPLPRCDSITNVPHSYGPLDLAGRTVTVHNLKVPYSPIEKVTVSLSPDPYPPAGNAGYHWNGGDVVVDFPDAGFSRSWTTGNSGTAWYSEIAMSCSDSSDAPQGAAAETSVQFNIGVIQTLNWAGTVTITATHCDGEVCSRTFDWCAMRNPVNCPSMPSTHIDVVAIPTEMELASTTLVVEGVDNVEITHVLMRPFDFDPDSSYRIFAIGAHESGSTERDMKGMAYIGGVTIFSGDTAQRYAARVDLVHGLPGGHTVEIPIVLEVPENLKEEDVPMIVEYYDENAQLIGRDTVELPAPGTTAVDDPTTGINTHGIDATLDNPEPSPTSGMVRLGYRLASPQRIRLELYDVTGNRMAAIEEGRRGAGGYEIMYDVGALANGTYMVVLTTESGDVVSRPIVLQH